jgi:hypothetical protein
MDDVNCVFLHLLESPTLCDRRAVETTTTSSSRRPVANLDESSTVVPESKSELDHNQARNLAVDELNPTSLRFVNCTVSTR